MKRLELVYLESFLFKLLETFIDVTFKISFYLGSFPITGTIPALWIAKLICFTCTPLRVDNTLAERMVHEEW